MHEKLKFLKKTYNHPNKMTNTKIDCKTCGITLPIDFLVKCDCERVYYCSNECKDLNHEIHKPNCVKKILNKNLNIIKNTITPKTILENMTATESEISNPPYILDTSINNKNNDRKGIKRVALRYTYDTKTLLPFEDLQSTWNVENTDVLPPDGTFMLLERSYFKAYQFLAITFYINFSESKSVINQISEGISKSIQESEYSKKKCILKRKEFKKRKKELESIFLDAISSLLNTGVKVVNSNSNGLYHFAGYSNSQLKRRACYMVKADKIDIKTVLYSIGDFEKIKDLAKLAKYIGLLFSTVKSPILLYKRDWEIIDDVESEDKKYCFTDGCGFAPTHLMRDIMRELRLPNALETISAVQIRFKGFKGMLVHNPKIKKIQFTKSMLKFDDKSHKSPLGICDWSRPYQPGYLILHYVLLLSTRGIADSIFVNFQKDYHNKIKKMLYDPYEAYSFVKKRQPSLAETFIKEGLSKEFISSLRALQREEIRRMSKSDIYNNKLANEVERVRIYIPKSRNAHGVQDSAGKLKYGEVFYRPTMANSKTIALIGKIVVGRTPCYSTGDMRILKCVNPGREYDHLHDVLVFPRDIRGGRKRPHSDEMSGGDLDGDLYWVCWDPSLIPEKDIEPFNYVPADKYGNYENSVEDRIKYFVEQDASILGYVDSVYFDYADRYKADCDECRELNSIFSRVVDSDPEGARERVKQLQRCITGPPKEYIWRKVAEENKRLRHDISPDFGVVVKPPRIFKGNAYVYDDRFTTVMSIDNDAPIFSWNKKNKQRFKLGTIVKFLSKWDALKNQYWAFNITEEPKKTISDLALNFNIPKCKGVIVKMFDKEEGWEHSTIPLGIIQFSHEYVRDIANLGENDFVPVTEIAFNVESIRHQNNLIINDLYLGCDIRFNLAYNYRSDPLVMDIDIVKDENDRMKNKEEVRENKSIKKIEFSDEIKEKIFNLLDKNQYQYNETLIYSYCSKYLSKLDYKTYGFKNMHTMMINIPNVKVIKDAAGDYCYKVKVENKNDIEFETTKDTLDRKMHRSISSNTDNEIVENLQWSYMPRTECKTEITNSMTEMSINNERSASSEFVCENLSTDTDQKTDEQSTMLPSNEDDNNILHDFSVKKDKKINNIDNGSDNNMLYPNSDEKDNKINNIDNNEMRRKCYICEEFGHISLDCKSQNKTTCFNCGSIGHRTGNCPDINDPNFKQVCRKFVQYGKCVYGRSCKFRHNYSKKNIVNLDIRNKGYTNFRFSENKQENTLLVNADRLEFYRNKDYDRYKPNPNFENFHSESIENNKTDNLKKEIEMLKLKLKKEKLEKIQESIDDNKRDAEQCNDLLNHPNMLSKIDDNLSYKKNIFDSNDSKETEIYNNKINDRIEYNSRKDDDDDYYSKNMY